MRNKSAVRKLRGSFTPRFTFFAGTLFLHLCEVESPLPDPVRHDTVELVKKMN